MLNNWKIKQKITKSMISDYLGIYNWKKNAFSEDPPDMIFSANMSIKISKNSLHGASQGLVSVQIC